jgi:DNA polymerase III delta prime subunit
MQLHMQSPGLMWVLRLPHPIAAMLFCGPVGVEKTELTKALAKHYFGSVSICTLVEFGWVCHFCVRFQYFLLLAIVTIMQRACFK